MKKCKYQLDIPKRKGSTGLPSKPKCTKINKSCIACKFCGRTGTFILNDRAEFICDKFDELIGD